MKLKIRIILAITLIFSTIPAHSQGRRQSPPTNLDNFISNVSALITLTNGIVRQSKITHGFRKETSEYFNSTTSKFNALFKLNLMDVADSVTNFYAAVQKLDLSSDFKSLEKPVSLLMNLAGDSANLNIQKSDIQNYAKLLNDTENLLDVGLDLEPPDFRILRKVERCLIASETLAEIGSCKKSMGLLNVSKLEIPFKRLDKLLEKLAPIQKLIDSFKRIKSLGLVVYAESEFSNDNGVFQNLSESLKNASVSLKGVEELMSGNVKNLAQKLKTAVLYSKIQPNEEQREKMNEFFALFNSTWFGKFLGKESFRKLKVGLQPFLNYTIDTEKVEKIVEDSRDFQKASERILKYIYIIAAWDEPYSIQSSLITAVEKCTPSISNATFDFSEFRKTWDFSNQLVADLDQYILSIKDVIKIKEDIIQGSKDLKENLEKWKLENWHQVQFHLDQFLKQNSSKSVKNLMKNLNLAFSVHTKYLQKIQFLNKTLANHPDPKIIEDTLDSVDTENILSISKCLSEKNFQVGYIEDTLKGADRLKRFKKRITSEDMNSLKKYMERSNKSYFQTFTGFESLSKFNCFIPEVIYPIPNIEIPISQDDVNEASKTMDEVEKETEIRRDEESGGRGVDIPLKPEDSGSRIPEEEEAGGRGVDIPKNGLPSESENADVEKPDKFGPDGSIIDSSEELTDADLEDLAKDLGKEVYGNVMNKAKEFGWKDSESESEVSDSDSLDPNSISAQAEIPSDSEGSRVVVANDNDGVVLPDQEELTDEELARINAESVKPAAPVAPEVPASRPNVRGGRIGSGVQPDSATQHSVLIQLLIVSLVFLAL